MNKEIMEISLYDFSKEEYEYGGKKDSPFKVVNEKTTYSDLEKGYQNKEFILQRKLDNLFFKFKVSVSPYVSLINSCGNGNSDPLLGTQVFPKEITITIYE